MSNTALRISLFILICLSFNLYASSPFKIRALADFYYAANTPSQETNTPYPFSYTYSQLNTAQLNHALILANYETSHYRSELGLHMGKYVETNYAAEIPWTRSIYSAYLGYKLSPTIWVDLGIFPSHIGMESAISKDNWMLSRSILADNSPYYESGARLSYAANAKTTLTAYALNGWQVISDTNQNKAFGTQIQYQWSPKLILNSSTFLGNEQENHSPSRQRIFHNFYAIYTVSETLKLAGDLDTGWQENEEKNNSEFWYAWLIQAQYQIHKKWSFSGRIESYQDPSGVITAQLEANAYAIRTDYTLNKKTVSRWEIKHLQLNHQDSQTIFTTAVILEL